MQSNNSKRQRRKYNKNENSNQNKLFGSRFWFCFSLSVFTKYTNRLFSIVTRRAVFC